MGLLTWSATGNVTRLMDEYSVTAAKLEKYGREYRALVKRANAVSEKMIRTRQVLRDIVADVEKVVRES